MLLCTLLPCYVTVYSPPMLVCYCVLSYHAMLPCTFLPCYVTVYFPTMLGYCVLSYLLPTMLCYCVLSYHAMLLCTILPCYVTVYFPTIARYIRRVVYTVCTNKKWMPNLNEGQICTKFANVWSYPQKQTLHIAIQFALRTSKRKSELARERVMYLAGNKKLCTILPCYVTVSQVSPGSWQLQFWHGS